jgi:hypothetical protein
MAAAFQDEHGRFTGKPKGPRVQPGEFRLCTRCHDERDTSLFSPDPKNRDGLSSWCRPCRAEDAREKRRIARGEMTPEEFGIRKLRLSKNMLIARLAVLLGAARAARTAGCWRGREGIRAYRDLGIAIESFHVEAPETMDAMERESPPCTCHLPAIGCARHADAVTAYLATHPEAA